MRVGASWKFNRSGYISTCNKSDYQLLIDKKAHLITYIKIEESEKNSFYLLVDSLKKSRRADLSDINNDDDIIEDLYVVPLDSDSVLKSC